MEKVLKFFVQEAWKSTAELIRLPIYLEKDVNIELCSFDEARAITKPFTKDETGKAQLQCCVDGWNLDSKKQYYFEVEIPWQKPTDCPFDLDEIVPGIYIPVQLINFMKSSNVASIGLWSQHGDEGIINYVMSQLENMGIKNLHNRGKLGHDGIFASYVEQQEIPGKITDSPRVSKVKILKPAEEKPAKSKGKRVVTQFAGDLTVLDSRVISVLSKVYKGKKISLFPEGQDLKILIYAYKGQKPSKEE